MHNQRQSTRIADRVEVIEAVLRFESKAQPMVGRHDVERRSAGLLRQLRVVNRFGDTFADDRRDDGTDVLYRVGSDSSHLRALASCERKHLAGMAVRHQADYALALREPHGEATQLRLVDAVISAKRYRERGDDAAKISHDRHIEYLQKVSLRQ